MLKKGDLIIGVVILMLISISFFGIKVYKHFSGDTAHTALVIQDGKTLYSIELDTVSDTKSIRVDGKYKHVILVEHGKIRFSEADCPDKICVRTGWLTELGDIAACIPDRIVIKVEGNKDNVDSVSY